MAEHDFPILNASALLDTREACHAYASVLGDWTTSCRSRRKHWWHLSLRPNLRGVTTEMIHADGVHFELELDLATKAFKMNSAELRRVILHGFKRSFFPGTYREKRDYVRHVIDYYDNIALTHGLPIAKARGSD